MYEKCVCKCVRVKCVRVKCVCVKCVSLFVVTYIQCSFCCRWKKEMGEMIKKGEDDASPSAKETFCFEKLLLDTLAEAWLPCSFSRYKWMLHQLLIVGVVQPQSVMTALLTPNSTYSSCIARTVVGGAVFWDAFEFCISSLLQPKKLGASSFKMEIAHKIDELAPKVNSNVAELTQYVLEQFADLIEKLCLANGNVEVADLLAAATYIKTILAIVKISAANLTSSETQSIHAQMEGWKTKYEKFNASGHIESLQNAILAFQAQ